ncbi:MAG: hypothetical protein WC475_03610 [Candidatus Paceibacterota bacterium]
MAIYEVYHAKKSTKDKNKFDYTVFLIDTKSKKAMSYNECNHRAFPLNQVKNNKTIDSLLNEIDKCKRKNTLFITGSQITSEAFSIFYESCEKYGRGIQKIGSLLLENIVVLKKAIYDKENSSH